MSFARQHWLHPVLDVCYPDLIEALVDLPRHHASVLVQHFQQVLGRGGHGRHLADIPGDGDAAAGHPSHQHLVAGSECMAGRGGRSKYFSCSASRASKQVRGAAKKLPAPGLGVLLALAADEINPHTRDPR
jgi:hypothetical protein